MGTTEKLRGLPCMIKGCERPIRSLGFCDSHYAKWRRYGHPLADEIGYFRHGHRGGGSESREYRSWQAMRKRCTDPNNPAWPDYGARGISVCTRWLQSFQNFFDDMGECPDGETIDRIDFNGNYEPGNVRWASRAVQQANRRCVLLDVNTVLSMRARNASGERVCDLAREIGVPYHTLYKAVSGQSWKSANV